LDAGAELKQSDQSPIGAISEQTFVPERGDREGSASAVYKMVYIEWAAALTAITEV